MIQRIDFRIMTLKEATDIPYIKSKSRQYLYTIVRAYGRKWNESMLSMPCAACGYDKHVQLAHIKPVASFPDTTTLAEVNSPDNVVQLCPNCHWELDHKLLSLEKIWEGRSESNRNLHRS